MHTLLLAPSDVLFFRDGRPMGGSLAGHSASWPLPNITNAALHAALWRAGFAGQAHAHRRARSGSFLSQDRENQGECFGSLATAGPFPVCTAGAAHTWFFQRPLDAIGSEECGLRLSAQPVNTGTGSSSIQEHAHLSFSIASLLPPSKNVAPNWWSEGAWNRYLGTAQRNELAARPFFKADTDLCDTEAQIGIGIDPESQAQDGKSIYSAHYLRMREAWRLGLLAKAEDKDFPLYPDAKGRGDLLRALFPPVGSTSLVVGGQQRLCTASFQTATGARLPLPLGKQTGFAVASIDGAESHLVKWVLLSPAIWPEIISGTSARGTEVRAHPGGWLPNWIEPKSLRVLLRSVSEGERRNRRQLNYNGKGYASDQNAAQIGARLVSALVPKPLTVTGWSLGDERLGVEATAGAKPTHLAVQAGAVYYFSCDSAEDAIALASALNWHGDTEGTAILRRRSTLLGEKGFGLGVCGSWDFLDKPTR